MAIVTFGSNIIPRICTAFIIVEFELKMVICFVCDLLIIFFHKSRFQITGLDILGDSAT